MHILTSHYYQQGSNFSTLLLQQYQCSRIPICLICLCGGENEAQGKAGAYLTGRLLQWFREQSMRHLVKSPEERLSALQDRLRELILCTDKELKSSILKSEEKNTEPVGILSVGEDFLLFGRGGQKIYLINRIFGRSHVRRLDGELFCGGGDALIFRRGILQQSVGLLFATRSFGEPMTERELGECLHVESVRTEEQAARHLRELAEGSRLQRGHNMSAALLLTGQKAADRRKKAYD